MSERGRYQIDARGTQILRLTKGVRVYEEICFLVGKYAPSSKVQHAVVDEGNTTPKLPPLALTEEETLPKLGSTNKAESSILRAETIADTGASEETKNLGVQSEPAPVTGIAEKLENPTLEDISGNNDTDLSSLKLTHDEPAIDKLALGLDVPSTETPNSAPITDSEAGVVPAHVDHASRE